jgi:hypothetical protein
MKNIPDFLTPVHKELEKHFIQDVIVNRFLKIIRKDTVEFINDSQHLLQK